MYSRQCRFPEIFAVSCEKSLRGEKEAYVEFDISIEGLLVGQPSLKLWNEGVGLARPADSLIPFRIYRVGKAKTRPTNSGRAVMNGVTRRTRRDYARRGTSIKRARASERERKKSQRDASCEGLTPSQTTVNTESNGSLGV